MKMTTEEKPRSWLASSLYVLHFPFSFWHFYRRLTGLATGGGLYSTTTWLITATGRPGAL
jgi:hypothetical protein